MQGKLVAPGRSRPSRWLVAYIVAAVVGYAYIELGWWWWRAKWRFRAVVPWGVRRWVR